MKVVSVSPLLAGVLIFAGVEAFCSEPSWSLASPDKKCVISVSLNGAGELSYEVKHNGKRVIQPSPLGLIRDDQAFDRALTFEGAQETENRRETYELFAGTQPQVDHVINHRNLLFCNTNKAEMGLELAAGNEGVAFRYHFDNKTSEIHVLQSELTGFGLPKTSRGWLQPYHEAGPYTPAYEDFYFHVSPGDLPPKSRAKPLGWSFPALFEAPSAASWVLLTESGNDGAYCACHLGADSQGGVYRVAFPATNETTKGIVSQVGPQPRYSLPWTMPWRVMVLGKTAREIATATLVTDLAPPSRIVDTSWIHPGRASWSWWSYPEGPNTVARFNEFTDFASKMGWEYTLFDAGWWSPGLTTIADHALAKHVVPLVWCFATEFYNAEKRTNKLDDLASAGVGGVKVDFWCSDRQEAIGAMHSLFEDAAARHILVNLHGCTVPRGWQRTWPNFLAAEAVLGNESYFYEPRYTQKAAELNTVLPFTRNAVGPMDITPVGCSPKKFVRTTTAAHELAASLIYTSGLIHYADKPEFFESLPPQALQVFRDAPARWDETRCLVGEPGRVVVFARRSGSSWFIAGINGTDRPLPVSLDLSDFKGFTKRLTIAEGPNASMQVAVSSQKVSRKWKHQLPARGGVILRLDK